MVTVIINNRDLVTWPRIMVETIRRWQGLHEIIILDNGSTYGPLHDWYETLEGKTRVIYLNNLGQAAAWKSDILQDIATDFYVVTDPDLDLSGVPDNCLLYLKGLLEKNPSYRKIGLGLEVDGIPPDSLYFHHVNTYERHLRGLPKDESGLVPAAVDTTFAIYDRRIVRDYFIGGARTDEPYIAKHVPWYLTKYNREFAYYLDHADGLASSFKTFTKYPNERSFRSLYKEHSGKVSTKWESYLSVYDEIFWPYRDKAIRLLEIGVQNGGSLEILSKYFPLATIVGCDINPKCANLKYEDRRITVLVGNINDKRTEDQIASVSGTFDVIIDDGSHLSDDVVQSFLRYFPRLAFGGIYIVEDTHCAYWERYGGGIHNQKSAANFFKSLVDAINADHFSDHMRAGQLFHEFAPSDFMQTFLTDNPILSIAAHDSMFVIRKASNERPRGLGKEIIVGQESIAQPLLPLVPGDETLGDTLFVSRTTDADPNGLRVESPTMKSGAMFGSPMRPPKLTVFCVAYKRYDKIPVLIHSFMCQTFTDFRLVVLHDGEDADMRALLSRFKEEYPDRFEFHFTENRFNDYGHSLRAIAIEQCDSDFIMLTNDDNYYVPSFLKYMFDKVDSEGLDLVLCDMIHSHDRPGGRPQGSYNAFTTEPRKLDVDIGCFVVKTELAKAVGFRDKTHDGDGTFVDDVMNNSGRSVKWGKVDKILFVHN